MEIKGIKYVGPIFDACYDDQTEVLTDRGWLFFKDLKEVDRLCTLNSDHLIEYHSPTKLISVDWDGDMYRFYSSKSCIDLLVTPNHNLYVRTEAMQKKKRLDGWKFEKPNDIFGYCRFFKKDGFWNVNGLPSTIEVNEKLVNTDDWLEFLGYYLSEGSSTITNNNHYIVQIRQFGENLYTMADALNRVTDNKINIIEKEGKVIVNDKDLCIYLKETFGDKYNKHIPRNILNYASKEQLLILFESLMLGDGHDNRPNLGGSNYYTSSYRLRDDFMELLLKIGFSGSYVKRYSKGDLIKVFDRECVAKEDHWSIRIKFSRNECSKRPYADSKTIEEYIHYKGKVYCATVPPNHTLYVRRNGFPVWCGNSGYAQASRGYILALHRLGVPITLKAISFEKDLPDLGEDGKILKKLANKNIDYNITILHSTPEHWASLREPSKFNVGYCVWETTKLHPSWPDYINENVKACMVSCDWSVGVYKDSGVTVPVFSVPHGIDVSEFNDIEPYEVKGVKQGAYKFYAIFQFIERKHPMALIKAYWSAFQNGENVALLLKTYRMGFSDQEKAVIVDTIKRLKSMMPMDSYPPIHFIGDVLSREQILGLHKTGDCLVSLDRGEGFGLVPFEAGACGNPIVVTGLGGVNEYAKPEHSYIVNYTLTPVFGMPQSPWYRGDQMWAEPDLGNAVKFMRHIYRHQEEAANKGRMLKQYISDNLSWDQMGMRMLEAIKSI